MVCLAFSVPVSGQRYTLGVFKERAENAFDSKDYATAFSHSREVLKYDRDNLKYLDIAVQSGLKLQAFDITYDYLRRIEHIPGNKYPLLFFLMAKCRHQVGEYKEAKDYYERFLASPNGYTAGARYQQLAKAKIKDCEAVDSPSDNMNATVRPLTAINRPEHSEFAMPLHGEDVYFSRVTPYGKCNCHDPCMDKMEIFRIDTIEKLTTSRDSYTPLLNAVDTVEELLLFPDSLENIGHVTFTADTSRMYFTSCQCNDDGYTCSIYYRDRSETDNSWLTPVRLDKTINVPGYTATHPYIYDPPGYGPDTLYFVSNYHSERNGTCRECPDERYLYPEQDTALRKDLDIWFVTVNGNDFSKPERLDAINTCGDEVTPFYHGPTRTLYFSTNGRLSRGGYDFDVYRYIYRDPARKCEEEKYAIEQPINLGSSVNSPNNDFSFSLNETGDRLLFSSNRGLAEDTTTLKHCCPDVYSGEVVPDKTQIEVSVFCGSRESAGYALSEAALRRGLKLSLVDIQLEKTLWTNAEDPEKINYLIPNIDLNRELRLKAELPGYVGDIQTFNSNECPKDGVPVSLYLQPKIELKLQFWDRDPCTLDSSMIVVKKINLYSERQEIVPMEYDSIQQVFKAKLRPDRHYKIDTSSIILDDPTYKKDARSALVADSGPFKTFCEPDTLERSFYWKKHPTVLLKFEAAIPIYFFDNIPKVYDPATISYQQYYKEYLDLKKDFEDAACSSKGQVAAFFRKMADNMFQLEAYIDTIRSILKDYPSYKVDITVWGKTSNTGSVPFNERLAAKRIESFIFYLKDKLPGHSVGKIEEPDGDNFDVRISSEAIGKDGAFDGELSPECWIYDTRASNDRKVEIQMIKLTPPETLPCPESYKYSDRRR